MGTTLIVNLCGFSGVSLPEGVSIVETLRPLGAAGRVTRAMCRRLCSGSVKFFEDYVAFDAAATSADTIILFDYKGLPGLMQRVERLAPQARKVVFCWNLWDDMSALYRSGWEYWTFDASEARRHGIRYAGQFF